MKILRVAQKVYPDVKGGGPYHVHAMGRDQAKMGHDITALTVAATQIPPNAKNATDTLSSVSTRREAYWATRSRSS